MTTTVKLHVNGRYRAVVKQDGKPDVEVHGNYPGSPNPTGQHSFNLNTHAGNVTKSLFEIEEHHVPEEPPEQIDQSELDTDFTA